MEKPLVNPSLERTSRGLLAASAVPAGVTRLRAPTPSAPVSRFRRDICVMLASISSQVFHLMAVL